jgi:hypothetical protein
LRQACGQAVRQECSLRESDAESVPTANRSAESFGFYSRSTATNNFEIGSIHFKVKDFNVWQTSYNGNEKNRTSAGITKSKVFRSTDDPNDVLLLQDVADVSKARTWLGSNEMKTVMEKSGVVGAPSIRFAA